MGYIFFLKNILPVRKIFVLLHPISKEESSKKTNNNAAFV